MTSTRSGPLDGVRIVEFRGLGPAPFAGMLLSDLGAEIVRVDRPSGSRDRPDADVLGRNRRSIAIDLKNPSGRDVALDLVARADGLIEGFRPGVMEGIGLGPEACLARNPRLVYGRVTGWGQDGPYARAAGHDINYIALTGALAAIGRTGEPPVVPLALVGDFGGGGMLLALGMLAGLFEARASNVGQVVDSAIIDAVALMMTSFTSYHSRGEWRLERGTNSVDSGAYFYDVYECADGEYIAVGALEPAFYGRLLEAIGLDDLDPADQRDPAKAEPARERFRERFLTKSRDEWAELLSECTDICFAPVLSMAEAPAHPHNMARGTFTEVDGLVQGAVAPRLSRTPGRIRRSPARAGEHTAEILGELGLGEDDIAGLLRDGAVT